MFKKKADDLITVPHRVQTRARRALEMGGSSMWIDQTLFLIGSNLTHHRPGDALLDEAIQSAEALLALLVEKKRLEA